MEEDEREYVQIQMSTDRQETYPTEEKKGDDSINQSTMSMNLGGEIENEGKITKKVIFSKAQQDKDWEEMILKQRKENRAISLVLSFLSILSYAYLQRECPYDSDQKCLEEFINPNIIIWSILILYNSWSTVKQFNFMIEKSTSYPVCVTGFLLNIYLFVYYKRIISPTNYMGVFNFLHFITFCALMAIFMMDRSFTTCIYTHRLLSLVYIGLFLSIAGGIIYLIKFKNSCDYWNGEIDNSIIGLCKIKNPQVCWSKVINKWQDLSSFLPTCQEEFAESQKLLIMNENRFIAYSSKINQLSDEKLFDGEFQKNVLLNSLQFNTIEEAIQSGSEIIFDKSIQSYQIDISKNTTLTQDRNKIRNERKEDPLSKNVLIIFLAHISRQQMHLKLPSTISYLRESKIKGDSEFLEFYRYNSIEKYSNKSYQSIFYENHGHEAQVSNHTKRQNIINDFKEAGFITGHSSDVCSTPGGASLNSTQEYEIMRADHESASFSCDKNYQDSENKRTYSSGPHSLVRRCLYGKQISEYVLEYTQSFFKSYNSSNKFFLAEFHEGLDLTGEAISYLDQPLLNFLTSMDKQNLLSDTTVLLLSDDGRNKQGILSYLNFESTQLEMNIPGLIIRVPKSLADQQSETLIKNQQSLITGSNIYSFLKDIIRTNSTSDNISLLSSSLKTQLQCPQLDIDQDNCSCNQ